MIRDLFDVLTAWAIGFVWAIIITAGLIGLGILLGVIP